jgi:capsular exopolysaccharide synthesis family protein
MKSLPSHTLKEENYIVELFKQVLPYKWIILLIMVLFVLSARFYLYFIPSVYESYAIVKVKAGAKDITKTEDLLRDTIYKTNTAGIEEEISILRTFRINKQALDVVDFQVQYFKKENYKQHELYENIPIKVLNIDKVSRKFRGQPITLIPKGDFFTLESEKLSSSKQYRYNELIETPFFSAKIQKDRAFKSPITIKINGDKREIYEDFIKPRLTISRVDLKSNLINISFQDTIPERANNYVDTLVAVYIEESLKKKNSINNKILEFLDERLEKTKGELEISENLLESYQSKHESIDPSVKSTNFFEKLSNVDLTLSEIALKKELIDNLKKYISHNRNLDAIAPTMLEFHDESSIKLIDSLNLLQREEDTLVIEYTDSYPRLVQIRQRMAGIKQKIKQNIENMSDVLNIKEKSLLKQKKKYESVLTSLPKKEKKLISYKRNYEVKSKMYTYLLEKKSENELIKVASVSDYEAVDKAYTSTTPVKPKKAIFMVSAALIGLVLGIFFALMRSLMVDKVQGQKQVELLTKLPIYGNIPLYKDKLLVNTSLEEAYRKLAMNLQFFKKEEEGNVVLVSSMVQGEGKTTTLVNLSSIFENTQYKAIIVDLDMHHPSLHKYFGLEQQYSGVSTYLSQRDNLGNVIFTTSNPNINIIPSGPTPPNPIELMLSPRLDELFTLLKREYDYIFVDTGSLDIAMETFHLMQYSDMNLMVFREGVSKQSSISDLERITRERGLTNIGLVLKTNPVVEKKVTQPDPQAIEHKQRPLKVIL